MKTIGSILRVAAVVVGIAALAVSGAGLAIGVSAGTLWLASTGLTIAASLIGGRGGGSQKPETTETSIKSPLAPRIDAFGTSRLYPALSCWETAPDGSTVDVGAFCEGPADAIVATYLNDDQVTVVGDTVQPLADKSYQSGLVRMGWSLGAATETAFSAVIAVLPGRVTSDHRGDGVVTGYLIKGPEREKYYLETYPQGDNVQMSLVGRWKKVFDWRDPTQDAYDPSTWKWSANAVLCFVWYLMVRRSMDWNTRFLPNIDKLTAAADDCDEAMPLAGGGTEPRYRTSLSYKLTDQPSAIIASFLACFDGWYDTDELGQVIIYSGRFYEPTVSLGPAEIAGFSVPYGIPIEDAINEITIQYVSADHDWRMVDAESWRDEDAITASGREPNTSDLGAVVPSHTQARRLAKRKMARSRHAPITITTTIAGDAVIGERYVHVDLTEAGTTFYEGPVEIITAPERDMATGGVTFQCIPADPNIDAWNAATEDGEGAPVEGRVPREPLPPPSIVSAYPSFVEATDSGTGVRISITAADPGALGVTWFARWRKDSSAVWVEQQFPDEDPGPGVSLVTGLVPVDPSVEVQVEYRTADGRLSGWSTTAYVDTRTDQEAPDDAQAPELVDWTDALIVSAPRIARASSYRWRFYASDGTTLLREIVTPTATATYTAVQAAADGVQRAYVVKVAGVNSGGTGLEAATGVLSHPAPDAVSSPAITGGATSAAASCDPEPGAAGYVLFYSDTPGFDPETEGGGVKSGNPAAIPLYGLAAGTYYARLAAHDQWSANPALLNLSSEMSFTITTGGGSTPSGGGTGGGGYGGWSPYPIP